MRSSMRSLLKVRCEAGTGFFGSGRCWALPDAFHRYDSPVCTFARCTNLPILRAPARAPGWQQLNSASASPLQRAPRSRAGGSSGEALRYDFIRGRAVSAVLSNGHLHPDVVSIGIETI